MVVTMHNPSRVAESTLTVPAVRSGRHRRRDTLGAMLVALSQLMPLPLLQPVADAGCCGETVTAAAPAPTQTYRLDFQTVYDERQMEAVRVTYETVYDTKTYTVSKPVWETQTTQRRSTVQRPVWETQTREERSTVMKPVWETVVEDRSYDQVRDVVETSTREERFTVMKPVAETVMQQQVSMVRKPVYETAMQQQVTTVRKPVTETVMQQQVSVVRKPVAETVMQQQVSVVRKPVYETAEREEAYTVAEPVTTYKTAYADRGGYVDQVTPMVAPGSTQLGWVQGGMGSQPVHRFGELAAWGLRLDDDAGRRHESGQPCLPAERRGDAGPRDDRRQPRRHPEGAGADDALR